MSLPPAPVCNNSGELYYVPPRHEALRRYRNRFLTITKEIAPCSTFKDCWKVSSAEDSQALLSEHIDWSLTKAVNESIVYVTYWPECYGHIFETFFHLRKRIEGEKGRKAMLNIPTCFPNLIDLANHIFGDSLVNSALFEQDSLYTFRDVAIIPNFRHGNPDFFMWDDPVLIDKIQRYYDSPNVSSHERVFLTKTGRRSSDTIDNIREIEGLLRANGFTVIDPQHESDRTLYNVLKNARIIVTGNGSSLCPLVTLPNYSARIFILNARRYLPQWRKPCKTEGEVAQLLQESPHLGVCCR